MDDSCNMVQKNCTPRTAYYSENCYKYVTLAHVATICYFHCVDLPDDSHVKKKAQYNKEVAQKTDSVIDFRFSS